MCFLSVVNNIFINEIPYQSAISPFETRLRHLICLEHCVSEFLADHLLLENNIMSFPSFQDMIIKTVKINEIQKRGNFANRLFI